MAALNELLIGGQDVEAVADPGAEISLITHDAAMRLALPIHTRWKPRLCPVWSRKPYTTMGYVNAKVEIENGPRRWARFAVVDRPQKWELLVGSPLLKDLEIELMTPAMRKRMRSKMSLDLVKRPQTESAPEMASIPPISDDDYRDLPVPMGAEDYVVDDTPIELLTDADAEAVTGSGANEGEKVVRPRKMRVKLGLPAGFFMLERDADFYRWDALFPAVSRDNVASRVVHQLERPEDAEMLLEQLMSGAAALRDYPSGCPPPAAVRPIKPPMRPDAKLIYTVQHEMSEAAMVAREEFVGTRLEYGIDEPTKAYCQMPVFTRPKPNTTARRVLFDDSANNCLNMIHTGIQLSTWTQIISFLRDAKLLTSVDLASFFTTIRLDPDIRDFWCFQGGSHNRLRTCRLVQGNSESPAIAQALLEQVLGGILELRGKILIYIDNVYIKSVDGDVAEHLGLIGIMTRALAEYNLLLNVKKSVFAGTSNVDVLGLRWSADGSWQVPDHRVATLTDLPMPRTVSEIRRMAGGVNSISRHMPWVQAALMPFYQATSKERLTKSDIAELKPHWQTLRKCLLNVEHLYVPPPGAPLTLRVDAASAGVGAVLLAQRSEDPEDVAPVAYFSKIFDGMQGYRHSTWREAKGVVEAVQYFYTFLDGCANLVIESDAAAVVALFSHKTEHEADDLSRFRVELTALGVTKEMLVHRPGIRQETADWLSRARDNIRPRKPAKLRKVKEAEADAADAPFTVGMMTVDDSDIELSDVDDDYDNLDDELGADDNGQEEDERDERVDFPPPARRPVQTRRANVDEGDAAFTRARIAAALSEMPSVATFVDCQDDDAKILYWIALCQNRQTRLAEQRELTPEHDAVRLMRVFHNRLERSVAARRVGLQARWAMVLTRGAANEYATAVHEFLGHPGYERTIAFVRERVWCPALPTLVQRLVHQCANCQLNATQHHNHAMLEESALPQPREQIYIDLAHIGPSDDLVEHALMVRDANSTFMEVYPMEDQRAQTVVDTLTQNWFLIHGVPLVITSDNGVCFTSGIFQAMVTEYEVKHLTTARYHPQSDLAEIGIKVFKTALRKMRADRLEHNRWMEYIPRIVAAHAVMYSPTLGCTPLERFYGPADPQLELDDHAILERHGRLPSRQELESRLADQADELHRAVRQKARDRVNSHRDIRFFEPGNYVTMKRVGLPMALTVYRTRRLGPFRVESHYGTTYFLLDRNLNPLPQSVPLDSLLPYHGALPGDDDDEPDGPAGGGGHNPGPGVNHDNRSAAPSPDATDQMGPPPANDELPMPEQSSGFWTRVFSNDAGPGHQTVSDWAREQGIEWQDNLPSMDAQDEGDDEDDDANDDEYHPDGSSGYSGDDNSELDTDVDDNSSWGNHPGDAGTMGGPGVAHIASTDGSAVFPPGATEDSREEMDAIQSDTSISDVEVDSEGATAASSDADPFEDQSPGEVEQLRTNGPSERNEMVASAGEFGPSAQLDDGLLNYDDYASVMSDSTAGGADDMDVESATEAIVPNIATIEGDQFEYGGGFESDTQSIGVLQAPRRHSSRAETSSTEGQVEMEQEHQQRQEQDTDIDIDTASQSDSSSSSSSGEDGCTRVADYPLLLMAPWPYPNAEGEMQLSLRAPELINHPLSPIVVFPPSPLLIEMGPQEIEEYDPWQLTIELLDDAEVPESERPLPGYLIEGPQVPLVIERRPLPMETDPISPDSDDAPARGIKRRIHIRCRGAEELPNTFNVSPRLVPAKRPRLLPE